MDKPKLTGLYLLAVANLVAILLVGFLAIGHMGKGGGSSFSDPEAERAVAAALESRGLYEQAAEVYLNYLNSADLDDGKRANILYVVGNLYKEKLGDCQSALGQYERIKTLYPDSGVAKDVNRKMVACLEKLGKSMDAQNALEAASMAGAPKKAAVGQTILARIGEMEITDRDLADEIAALPPRMKAQMTGKEGKKQILQGIVQRELLVTAAIRSGLDKTPDVLNEVEKARKSVLASRVLEDEVFGKMDITPQQVAQYIQSHPDEFKDKDGKPLPMERAQQMAGRQVAQAEQARLTGKLMESLMAAQKAEIYEDRIE